MSGHRSGPVRSDDARRAILAATAAQFVELGYERLTIQGVAAAAKVGKQTIYRWWAGKADLLAECLLEGMLWEADLAVPDTGDVDADLRAWLAMLLGVGADEDGVGRLLLPLLGAAAYDENLARALHVLLHGGHEDGLAVRLRSAVEAGQLPAETDPEILAESLVGTVLVRTGGRTATTPEQLVALTDHALGRGARATEAVAGR